MANRVSNFFNKTLRLSNSQESVIPATPYDTTMDSKDLEDTNPHKIKKTIRNCRYAYNNDGLVQGLILNNTFKANNKWFITFDDPDIEGIMEAKEYIEDKCKEWNLDKRMSEWLIKEQRDGKHFTQKVIKDGTIQLNELAYDGENYDFEIIHDPRTGETLGYKQKYYVNKDYKSWKNKDFDTLNSQTKEYEEANYLPDEIIYGTLFEEDGKGMSLIMPILDDIYDKWSYEKYKLSVAHKTGNLAVMTVGSKDVYTENVPETFVDKALRQLKDRDKKDAVVIPYGTSIETLGGNYNLPDLNTYINKTLSNIYIQLQTPQTLFASDSSNRSTIQVQTDEETGFGVYLEYMRDTLKNTIENELFDVELELNGFEEAIGHIHLTFVSIKQNREVSHEYIDKDTMFDYTSDDEDLGNADVDASNELYNDDENNLPADNAGFSHYKEDDSGKSFEVDKDSSEEDKNG